MKAINGYLLTDSLRTAGGGKCKWGFAEKDGRIFFLKELLEPVYPSTDKSLPDEIVRRRIEICRRYENRQRILYKRINRCSTGGLQRIEEFFRADSHYYITTQALEQLSEEVVGDSAFSGEERRRAVYILVNALAALHGEGLTHGDIKLKNILFFRTPSGLISARIIDFEDVYPSEEAPDNGEKLNGDLVYLAPESLRLIRGENVTLTRAVDVFAMGLVCYQIMTGRQKIMTDEGMSYPCEMLLQGQELPFDFSPIPDPCRSVIESMLLTDPEKRITMQEAKYYLAGTPDVIYVAPAEPVPQEPILQEPIPLQPDPDDGGSVRTGRDREIVKVESSGVKTWKKA